MSEKPKTSPAMMTYYAAQDRRLRYNLTVALIEWNRGGGFKLSNEEIKAIVQMQMEAANASGAIEAKD